MGSEFEVQHEFEKAFSILVKGLVQCPEVDDMQETNKWLMKVLEFNVPHGKLTRGLTTVLAYRTMSKDFCEKNQKLSYILGWCLEMFHSAFLIGDDIMDGSETRRGQSCWYKVGNNGLAAINDIILLESSIYKTLKMHFKNKPYYVYLLEIFHDALLKTAYGQSLDTNTSKNKSFETYSMELYTKIVKYKTSYYTFYIPIRLAMAMAEITDARQIQEVKSLALKLGFLFQVQDDYLDCFGDPDITGKIGTDIQDDKCTWLYVTAQEKGNSQQKNLLQKLSKSVTTDVNIRVIDSCTVNTEYLTYLQADNPLLYMVLLLKKFAVFFVSQEMYGKNEENCIEAVKKLYSDIGLVEMFQNFEEKMYEEICAKIENLNMGTSLSTEIFHYLVNKIYKRTK